MKRIEVIHLAAQEYILNSVSNSKEAAFKAGAKYADRTMILNNTLIYNLHEKHIGLTNVLL